MWGANCSLSNSSTVVPLHCYDDAVHGPRCRDTHGYLLKDDYAEWTCSRCFVHIFDMLPDQNGQVWRPLKYDLQLGTKLYDHDSLSPKVYSPDALQEQSSVCSQFLTEDQCFRWRRCCSEAVRCCERQLEHQTAANLVSLTPPQCRMTWDGFACWNDTFANTVVHQACPDYYRRAGTFSVSPVLLASKTCTENGWFNNHSNIRVEWTNVTRCIDDDDDAKGLMIGVYTLSAVLHSISIAALLLSLVVLFLCRHIGSDITRLMLKVHFMLFLTFGAYHTTHLLYDTKYVKPMLLAGPTVAFDPQEAFTCKFTFMLLWYLRGATYCSLFCEVFYLLRRMQIRADSESFAVYIPIAFVVPLVPVTLLVIARLLQEPLENCWMVADPFTLIVVVPNISILLMNLAVLIVVQRKVIMSYRAAKRYLPNLVVVKRGVKVAGLLLPVFGVQNIVIIYRPQFWIYHEILEALILGTQGTIIAIVYCGLNNEIRKELLRMLNKYQRYRRSTGFTNSATSIIRRSNASRPSGEVARNSSVRQTSVCNAANAQPLIDTGKESQCNDLSTCKDYSSADSERV